mmetsp:Transcript_10586/g.39904  ORF Transcript_10586/g.39904 Transcript_10586/m.39904 type:complete len:80 (+) Transcript_10586:279-518(+)
MAGLKLQLALAIKRGLGIKVEPKLNTEPKLNVELELELKVELPRLRRRSKTSKPHPALAIQMTAARTSKRRAMDAPKLR